MPFEAKQQAFAERTHCGAKIPPQPKVLAELNRLIEKGDYDLQTASAVISKDPGLVAMLFKTTRPPAFSRQRRLDSLEQVLSKIGLEQTFDLIRSADTPIKLADEEFRALETYWTRSSDIALLAALIAKEQVAVCNVFPENAFLAGLFHQCGVPVLLKRFPTYCKTVRAHDCSAWPDRVLEDSKFNVDHNTIGYLLARHWGLPDFVCNTIRDHQDIPEDDPVESTTLICIVRLAIHFYRRMNQLPCDTWITMRCRVLEEIGVLIEDEDDYFEDTISRFIQTDNASSWRTITHQGF